MVTDFNNGQIQTDSSHLIRLFLTKYKKCEYQKEWRFLGYTNEKPKSPKIKTIYLDKNVTAENKIRKYADFKNLIKEAKNMSLELIEKEISSLDAGPFQNLSRAFINKKLKNYSCQANGSMIGSVKTTKSHPDCLFINNLNNKFIMVECTTQQTELRKKLKSDIDDCMDESQTKIPVSNIEKIIFCYSNGKIPNGDILKQKERLLSLGLKLELISVYDMALDIEDKYPELALEYLGINLYNSLNILSVDEFINDSNNGLSPSLDKIFSSRDNEIKELIDIFSKNNIIIVYGKSGVGKSKIAIELLKNIEADESKIKCIKARGLFDYTDLLRIAGNTDYFLIDDADKFADVQAIINYLKNKKIIFTIRDYELLNFLSKIDDLEVNYFKYELKPFTDEAVNKVINDNLGPCDNSFLVKLNELVKGNIRLAFMVAETCKKNKNISALYDPRDIFGRYYKKRINKISKGKTDLILSCIGLITFNKQVDINELDEYTDLLTFFDIEKKDFIITIKYLEKEEIVSIFENEIVEMNDQCLSNYLEYYVFFNKKLIRLKDIFINLFPKYKMNIIAMLSHTLNVFFNNEDLEFIKSDLKECWDFYADKKDVLKELAGTFSLLNPKGTLKLLNDTIKENNIDEEWVVNSFNSIIDTETKLAIKLFKEYVIAGTLSIDNAEKILIDSYQFDKNDYLRNYEVQNTIVTELSNDFYIFIGTLSKYCLKLLQFEFEKNSVRDNKAIFSRMNIGNGNKYLYSLREKCINFLLKNNNIFDVFKTYFTYCPQENNIELFKKDIDSFNKAINLIKNDEIVESIIYFYSIQIFNCYKLKWDFLYNRNKNIIDFLEPVFKEPNDRSISFEDKETKYEKRLINSIQSNAQLTIDRVKKLVLFDYPLEMIQSQIENYFKFCINCIDQAYIDKLFQILTDSKWLTNNVHVVCYFIDRYKKINGFENTYKIIKDNIPSYCKAKAFEWLFISLKDNEINDVSTKLFNEYIDNIDKYPFTYFVPQQWINICQNSLKLLFVCKKALDFENKGLGPYALYLIFEQHNGDLLFNSLLKEDSKFIEKLYLKSLTQKNAYFDEDGSYLLNIVKNNVNFLSDFLNVFLYSHDDIYAKKRINALWNSNEYMVYGDILFSKLIDGDKKYLIPFYATTIMGGISFEKNKSISVNQLNWFEHSLIKFYKERENIIYLFECIKDFDFTSKVKCVELLFKYNNDFETFKQINLSPSIISFSGSEVPYIKNRIAFYEKIKESIPSEICFINHLNYVEEILQSLKDSIKNTLINEKKLSNRFNW